MEVFGDAIATAGRLLFSGDSGIYQIIWLSLRMSGISLLIAMAICIPLGYLIGSRRFRGRGLVVAIVNTGMGLPPVVAGLVVYMLISRTGPVADVWLRWTGEMMPRLLFTVPAMIMGQVLISAPLITGITSAAVGSVPRELRLQARSLGASAWQESLLTLREARRGVMASVVAGFGGIISEVGAVGMLGGNIAGHTRVMTTSIVYETQKGDFGTAMAIGFVLVGIAFIIMNGLTLLQWSGGRYER